MSNKAKTNTKKTEEYAQEFIRVRTNYYLIADYPLFSGETIKRLIPWEKSAIVDDYGKDFLASINKYTDFIIRPTHIKYEQDIKGFYNQYEPLPYSPKAGECPVILDFVKHIFGEQFELGLDYIQILYTMPTQILPVLCLVSEARKTGKSTFINLLKMIFGGNLTKNSNQDFTDNFNDDWARMLLICVEETMLDKAEVSEKIKELSTANSVKSQSKFNSKKEIDFFGKFILCSNHVRSFIKTDDKEIRYWVREIPEIKEENINLMEQMRQEIPAFLNFLLKRKMFSKNESRMWFAPALIWTQALQDVLDASRPLVERELRETLRDAFLDFQEWELKFCLKDLMQLVGNSGYKITKHQVQEVLKFKWKLSPVPKPSTYRLYSLSANELNDVINNGRTAVTMNGRYYTFHALNFLTEDEQKGLPEPLVVGQKPTNVSEKNTAILSPTTRNEDLPY